MEARLSWLIEFSPTHAGTFGAREDEVWRWRSVEDEESPHSCEDDTILEFSDSDDYSNDSSTYVQESFEVMFVLLEEIQQVN